MKIKNDRLKKLKKRELLELLIENENYINELETKISELGSCEEERAVGVSHINFEEQLNFVRKKERTKKIVFNMLYILILIFSLSVLISTYVISVLDIYGSSMAPTLYAGDTAVCLKNADYDTGDVLAFYCNNKLQVKRLIAKAGDWVYIDENGYVYVNDLKLEEPYVSELSLGSCDIDLPYQVPDACVFVMGDNRGVSIDSRYSDVGCIKEDEILGKLIFRIWPLSDAGIIK